MNSIKMKNNLYNTTLIIDTKKIISNINFFKSNNKNIKIIAMIKANAYGHGDIEIAKILEKENIYMLGVADFEEGIRLREKNIKSKIMVTAPTKNNIQEVINHNLEPCIYNFEILEEIIKINKKINIHIKFNTGMNRFGFDNNDINTCIEKIINNKNIHISSIFSHLANSNNKNDLFSIKQINRFTKINKIFNEIFKYKIDAHIHNTEGYISLNNNNIIRIGLGIYGYTKTYPEIKPISELKSHIIQIRKIKKNESIGYNRSFIAKKNMKIGIIPIGYADGIKRDWGNGKLKFLIKNKLYPVVGVVSMDSCMINITNTKIKEGEEVFYFNEKRNICELAKDLNTIPYEITSSLSKRIKRIYI